MISTGSSNGLIGKVSIRGGDTVSESGSVGGEVEIVGGSGGRGGNVILLGGLSQETSGGNLNLRSGTSIPLSVSSGDISVMTASGSGGSGSLTLGSDILVFPLVKFKFVVVIAKRMVLLV